MYVRIVIAMIVMYLVIVSNMISLVLRCTSESILIDFFFSLTDSFYTSDKLQSKLQTLITLNFDSTIII